MSENDRRCGHRVFVATFAAPTPFQLIWIFAVRELVETIVIGGSQTGLAISNHDARNAGLRIR
jgi:hypothetical protein